MLLKHPQVELRRASLIYYHPWLAREAYEVKVRAQSKSNIYNLFLSLDFIKLVAIVINWAAKPYSKFFKFADSRSCTG